MTRLAGLALAVAAVLWARSVAGASEAHSAATVLALGFTLLGAWVVSDVLRRLRVPRVTGYLLFGALIGPYLGNLITQAMAAQLNIVTGIATTLIALMAGLMVNVERLGARMAAVARVTGTTLAATMAGIGAIAWIAWTWLPIAPDASGTTRLVMVVMLAIIAVSFSPTMTAAIATETDARGRLSELVLAIVVLADLVLLVLFSLAMPLTRAVLGTSRAAGVTLLAQFAWEIGGSVAFGVLAGAMFAMYLRYIGREVTLAVLALCALLTQVGSTQELEPLLAAVAAGLVIENLAIAQGDSLRAAVRRAAPPVLIIFFVSVGMTLRLDVLAAVGPIALAISLVRLVLVRGGVAAGLRWSDAHDETGRYVWTGLISQAGITLGFAATIASEFPGWGTRIQMLLVALLAIHETAGPVLFRYGLSRADDAEPQTDRPLLVVSNREPYMHRQAPGGDVVAVPATGGVAVALDALMRERGGVWIAHGSGDADHLVVDDHDTVSVPPDGPAYELRRLWIEEPTFSQYYGGFANEGLWPLCHQVDVRPSFRADQWAAYQEVNERFAAAVDEELKTPDAPVFIQDYHLALVAPALRARRPAARTALFWHIPWPYPDRLRVCPWHEDLLRGLLANDLVAFQLERDRDRFLQAVEEDLGMEIERESSRVRCGDRFSTVVSVPIGVDFDRIQTIAADPALADEQVRLQRRFDLDHGLVGIGVDRLDYTKGIPERLAALDRLMTMRPDLRGLVTFVQIGVPSRSALGSYAAIEAEIGRRVAEINARHSIPGRPPLIRYDTTPLTLTSLVALYRLADFCIVSSLHDGMNLVAKEFVAARQDEDGVLVLSTLAGAAQELKEALIINPYDVDGFAAALSTALDMPREARRARMRAMRRAVAGRDVFLWASDILEGLESLWTKPLHYTVHQWEEMAV